MKKIHITIVLVVLICSIAIGQQQKTVSMTAQPQKTEVQILEEIVLQLQAENQAMQKQLESLKNEVEYYRGDVRTKVAELDSAQGHWLTMLAIIMGLIGVVFGIGVPLFINRDNSKRLESRFSEMKEDLKDQVKVATEQAKDAKEQADNAKEAFDKIHPQVKSATEQVASATEQVKVATEQANKAEEASKQMQIQVKSVTEQVTSASEQAKIAKEQAEQAKKAVDEIEELKKHVTAIEEKIKQDAVVAEKAANEAKASQLFTQALNEKESFIAIGLYNQAIELKPDFFEAYNNRGIRKYKIGDHTGEMFFFILLLCVYCFY